MGSMEEKKELFDDMVNMAVLDEASILNNLRDRFRQDIIYTHVGSILISVNPYRAIPSLYSKKMLDMFQDKNAAKNMPHIFKVTETAYRRMLDYEADQSILISGESGAGKTEACKCILQYLAEVSGQGGKIQQQILESNPLMEAFGNAKTVRNNNSSRFGKFIQLRFSRTGKLVGADITKYLLEKSRVVFQAPQERNYHIFYEMCAGLSGPLRSALHVGLADEYKYLNQGRCMTIEGVNDAAQFEITRHAMKTFGIADDKQQQIFQVLSAILHIGNIFFEFVKDTDSVIIKNEKEVDIAAKLLGVKSSALNFALCHRDIIVSGQTFKKPLDLKQALDSRDALAKGLYERLFDWLVARINQSIVSQETWHTIGVLDIFGFEFFDNNSLEQLCINYCNEKLQLMYNTYVFQQEQKEYQQEGINCEAVEFIDNQPCIDFFEKSLGVLSILDEECKFPAATDRTFLEKLEVNHKASAIFGKELRASTRFLVRHFAGEVLYDVTGFLDKNRDSLRPELSALVTKSELSYVRMLFEDKIPDIPTTPSTPSTPSTPTAPVSPSTPTAGGRLSTGPNAPTSSSVCSQFKAQLNNLMKMLSYTSPHFVRCVKPNVLKLPDIFDEKLVSAQLRYTGVLGTIRIRQAGFPVRFPFDEFVHRYCMIAQTKSKLGSNPKEAAGVLAQVLNIGIYQIGKTKIFFKNPRAFDELETKRKVQLSLAAAKIQSLYRGRKQFRKYRNIRKIAVAFQTAARAAHAHRLLLHLKEERTRRLREEQIQREKEQKTRDEQMRKEREQKQKEMEEKERERKAKQEEMTKKMEQDGKAKRYKYKYKHCTCTPKPNKEGEKENTNPNKLDGLNLLKDLLEKYGASSIGNVYDDGRVIQVELFQYKYEFMSKEHKPVTAAAPQIKKSFVPINVAPTPPKPPALPSKFVPLKKFAAKPLAKPGATPAGAPPAAPHPPGPGGPRGTTGVSTSLLSKFAQFQKPAPSPAPSVPVSPSHAPTNPLSPPSVPPPAPSTVSPPLPPPPPAPITTSAHSPLVPPPTPVPTSAHTPAPNGIKANGVNEEKDRGKEGGARMNGTGTNESAGENGILTKNLPDEASTKAEMENKPAPIPSSVPKPPNPPINHLANLPKPAPPAARRPPPPPQEEEEYRPLSFKELQARMAKKLPNLLTSLASTLQSQQDEEFNDTSNSMQTLEQYRSMITGGSTPSAPAPPDFTEGAPASVHQEPEKLSSLTKDRAKPQNRRPRTKPQKSSSPSTDAPAPATPAASIPSTPSPSIPPPSAPSPVIPQSPAHTTLTPKTPTIPSKTPTMTTLTPKTPTLAPQTPTLASQTPTLAPQTPNLAPKTPVTALLTPQTPTLAPPSTTVTALLTPTLSSEPSNPLPSLAPSARLQPGHLPTPLALSPDLSSSSAPPSRIVPSRPRTKSQVDPALLPPLSPQLATGPPSTSVNALLLSPQLTPTHPSTPAFTSLQTRLQSRPRPPAQEPSLSVQAKPSEPEKKRHSSLAISQAKPAPQNPAQAPQTSSTPQTPATPQPTTPQTPVTSQPSPQPSPLLSAQPASSLRAPSPAPNGRAPSPHPSVTSPLVPSLPQSLQAKNASSLPPKQPTTAPPPSPSVLPVKPSPRRFGAAAAQDGGSALKNIMGADVTTFDFVEDNGYKVPFFLGALRALLEKHKGHEKEGIFRLSGREETLHKIAQDILNGGPIECEDVLSIGAFVKRWYSKLPQKVFGHLSAKDVDMMYTHPRNGKDIIKQKLSETQYSLFWWLIALTTETASRQDQNKMNAKTLATLLGPVVLEVGSDMHDLHKNQKVITVLQYFLDHGIAG